MPQMRSMWGRGGRREGGQEDRVRYGPKVLSCVSNTSNGWRGDILHSRLEQQDNQRIVENLEKLDFPADFSRSIISTFSK